MTSARAYLDGVQVYGTSNIRVIDLSVLPIITVVHTQGAHPFPGLCAFYEG